MTELKTISLPAVGDRVVWAISGEKVKATVTGIFPRRVGYISARHPAAQLSAGGVRIAEDNGIAYSFHPETWMTLVLSGSIVKEG